nr:ribonuclease H [Tanacetum cinerariifolium]
MRTQLLDYGYKYNRIPMHCDSKSEITISCNLVQHSKTKHIDIRYHFIKEHVEQGTVELYFFGIEYQLADLFTKALPKECFEYLVHRIVASLFFWQWEPSSLAVGSSSDSGNFIAGSGNALESPSLMIITGSSHPYPDASINLIPFLLSHAASPSEILDTPP